MLSNYDIQRLKHIQNEHNPNYAHNPNYEILKKINSKSRDLDTKILNSEIFKSELSAILSEYALGVYNYRLKRKFRGRFAELLILKFNNLNLLNSAVLYRGKYILFVNKL